MTARQLHDEVLIGTHPVLGVRTAWVLPVIPDNAPYAVREGIARRRITVTTGRCPCGASVDFSDVLPGQVAAPEVLHDRHCPAGTARLVKACKRWAR